MPKLIRFTALALTLALFMSLAAAQDGADAYAETPMSRGADGAFVLGDADAPVKLIEFSDFLCGSCQNYEPVIAGFINDYVMTGLAQFEYRIFPVIDPQLSVESASLVECADALMPGAFWQAHDLMFEIVSERGYRAESKAHFAESLGLELAALQDCANEAGQHAIDAAYGFSLGVGGTPSLFVQYGDDPPLRIALAMPEHYPSIVNALRPAHEEPVSIEHGDYAGLRTQRLADGGFVLGDADAPLTIVAFEDFLCAHCQAYTPSIKQFIDEQVRTGRARFEFRFYPLVNPQHSTNFAKTAECVSNQDPRLFWDAHDLLFDFAEAGQYEELAAKLAGLLDLDAQALIACQERAIQFLVDAELGQTVAVSGTPAIRARDSQGQLKAIFAGQQPLDRGGIPLEVLTGLAEGRAGFSVGAPEPSLLNQRYLRDDSLLSGDPCAPPCWRDIVPGATEMPSAMEIVEAAENLRIIDSADSGLLFAQGDGEPCCQIASDDRGVVSTILLQFAPEISLGDALAAHGEPRFVSGQPFTESEAVIMLYYPERGMALYVVVPGIDGQLAPESPVVSAVFATRELLMAAFGATPFDHWKGYLSYSAYMDGEFDHRPQG